MTKKIFRLGVLSALIMGLSVLLVACGSGGGGGGGDAVGASITLNVNPDSIPANGVSSVVISVQMRDSANQPAEMDTKVGLSTTLGHFINGLSKITVRTPDDSGQVLVALIADTTAGNAEVTVESMGVTQLIKVEFIFDDSAGLPVAEEFGLSASFLNISGLRIFGLQNVIEAGVGDLFGNAVKDDTIIQFKTYNTGGLLDPPQWGTENGFALTTLFSTSNPIPLHGFLSVTAETEGGPGLAVTSIAVTPHPSKHIMYAGTNGGGVYKSTNSGATWTNVSRSSLNARQGANWIDPYVKGQSAICVDPDDPNTVYVGTGYLGKGNVYRSRDGGLNWNSNNTEQWNGILHVEEAHGVLVQSNKAVLTVLCDDGGSDYVWIGTEGRGPLYATDGETFQPSGGVATMPAPSPWNTGDGTMTQPVLSYSTQSETWTTTYVVPNNATATIPEDTRKAIPSVQTSSTTLTETWTLTCMVPSVEEEEVEECSDPSYDNEADCTDNGGTWGTTIISAVLAEFSVVGSVSGFQPGNAVVGTPYTSAGGQVRFIVYGDSFKFGDTLIFATHISPPFWQVQGSVSGPQNGFALNNQFYQSDNYEVGFTIIPGFFPFGDGDTFSFTVTANKVNHGWNVRDLVKVPGTRRNTAVLYAGTDVGVYKTANGAQTWNLTGRFTGDAISALALYPTATGGGNDVIYAGTQNAAVWVSTKSGAGAWRRLAAGLPNGKGTMIKDILVDPVNDYLYAVTASGDLDSPVGKVFVHSLSSTGEVTSSSWTEASDNLTENGLFVLALDNPSNPSALFLGGDISLSKAVTGLSAGDPLWQQSDSGMENIIMSRMPILFTDTCNMNIDTVRYDNTVFFTVYIQDTNGNPPISGSSFDVSAGGDTILELDYDDVYAHRGTFWDPSNPKTDNPYRFAIPIDCTEDDFEVEFTFSPACGSEVPGCSGQERIVIYPLACR